MNHLLANWKTSLSGLLSLLIATAAVLTAEPTTIMPQKYAGWLTIASGLAKAYIGLISRDAGSVVAIPAGETKPVAMPSTEVPLQPGATVVPEVKSL